MSKAILIAGATGKQGGAVLRSLLAHSSFSPSSYTIFAATRNPDSPSAKTLAAQSPAIRLVRGDLNNAAGLFAALPTKPWGVFALTYPGKNEEVEGKAFVDEAIKAGTSHFVFTSVARGSANGGNTPTDVPHFLTKHGVENHLMRAARESGDKLHYTILRPVFFLDNLNPGFIGKVIGTAWRDHVAGLPLQVVDTRDVGTFGANAFMRPEDPVYKNAELSLAGDELTFEQADAIFKDKVGVPLPTTYGFVASLLLWLSNDMGKMFKFFRETGFGADVDLVRREGKPTDFSTWVDMSPHVKKDA